MPKGMHAKPSLICVVAILLAGCATSPKIQEKSATLARTTPICMGEADCKAKWEAAQLWIAHNAGLKIQIATDVLLETYNPPAYSTKLAVRATKEPVGDGSYRISVRTWCNNIIRCYPDVWEAAQDFNRTVGAAGDFHLPDVHIGINIQNGTSRIASVTPGSGAAQAGLQEGDTVLEIEDQQVHVPEDVYRVLAHHAPGDTVAVRVERNGSHHTFAVTLGKR